MDGAAAIPLRNPASWLRTAARGVAGVPPRLSRWAWAADAVLALVLAVGTVSADLDRSYVEDAPREMVHHDGRLPDRGLVPEPPAPPNMIVPAVEHTLGPLPWWAVVLAVLTAVPLAWRRRRPLAAFWAVLVATALFHVSEVNRDATVVAFASVLIAAYSAAMYSPHRKAAGASLAAGAVLLAVGKLVPDVDRTLIPLLVLAPVALAANGLHAWRHRVRTLRAEQDAATRRAVDEERRRIARELHDVVTHNVSMMTIQAGAARKVLDVSTDQAREAMLAVEAAGRTAMSELRQVMGLLTMAADGSPENVDLAPQPGLGRLPELVDRVRGTGVPVELTVTGTPCELPAGVDLAAYRVVQEGLTNAVKHASGASVTVAVEYAPGELRVDVQDSGGVPTPAEGNGRGLIGLRERLAVYGGTLHNGRRPRGGYRVRAVIPVEAM
ncbi:sensor histidine kinase [Streptomyces sp. 4N124]|uniref:sensor histidine kinase n=1 Tax=Streptomyces sp. 4N124 TaxID=3457420 RepID=UPI003FD0A499